MSTYFCISMLSHDATVPYFINNSIMYYNADRNITHIYPSHRPGYYYVVQTDPTTIVALTLQVSRLRFVPIQDIEIDSRGSFYSIPITHDIT